MGFTLEGNEMKELITEQDQKAFRQWITDWSEELNDKEIKMILRYQKYRTWSRFSTY